MPTVVEKSKWEEVAIIDIEKVKLVALGKEGGTLGRLHYSIASLKSARVP